MSDSSIKSKFNFVSYKVDYCKYEMQRNITLLSLHKSIDATLWDLEIGIRQPLYIKDKKSYICGLDCRLLLFSSDQPERTPENSLLTVEAGIAGLFSIDDENEGGRLDKSVEERLVKIQMPAILLPYLRGAITTLIANAGFGGVTMPLINIQDLAKNSNIEIKELSPGK